MNTSQIIEALDMEIRKLELAKAALTGSAAAAAKKKPGRPAKATSVTQGSALPKKRKMSAAGRAKIAAAQKARWAKLKKARATI